MVKKQDKEKIPEPKPLEIPQDRPTLQFLEEAALAGDPEAEKLLDEMISDPKQLGMFTDFLEELEKTEK